MIFATLCSSLSRSLSTSTSGLAGASYGSSTPVKCLISPASAFLYRPFTSRSLSTSMGHCTYTSTKRPMALRISSRTSRYGEMAAVIATVPLRESSLATKPMRRMFVSRSSLEKPSPLLNVSRTSSPSSTSTFMPRSSSTCSTRRASVDFPEEGSPVNQSVKPFMCSPYSSAVCVGLLRIVSKNVPDHLRRRRNTKIIEDRGRDVVYRHRRSGSGRLAAPVPYKNTFLGMVGVIRAGVVVEDVHGRISHRARAAPVQVPQIYDKVGRDAAALAINLLGVERARTDGLPIFVAERLDLCGQLGAHTRRVGRRNGAFLFAALDVQKDARVVAAVTPRRRARPVDHVGLEARRFGGLFLEHEIAFALSLIHI